MTPPSPSRIEQVRVRATGMKRTIAAVAAAAFVAAFVLSRISHPGVVSGSSSSNTGGSAPSATAEDGGGLDSGGGPIGSSGGGAPDVQTNVS